MNKLSKDEIIDSLAIAVIYLVAFVVGLLTIITMTHAHTAPSGWYYDSKCCGGMDCAPIPASAVKERDGGFYVTLEPGQHPMVHKHWERAIPYSMVHASGDGEFHICIRGDNPAYIAPNEPICFYVPTGA